MSWKVLSVAAIASVVLAGCGGGGIGANLSPDNYTSEEYNLGPRPAIARNYHLHDIRLTVPGTLSVSEENSYYPDADIVWHGDPVGNRRAQIAVLFENAEDRLMPQMNGPRGIVVDATLVRFHGLTPRTRYTVGGIYDIDFVYTVRDAETGVVIEPERLAVLDLRTAGGDAETEFEANGLTERERIVAFLTREIYALLN